jgi:hypothetical protein
MDDQAFIGAEGHADADFVGPARHGVREDSVDSGSGQDKRKNSESGAKPGD